MDEINSENLNLEPATRGMSRSMFTWNLYCTTSLNTVPKFVH